MKKQSILLAAFQTIRVIATVLTITGMTFLSGLSMFSVPYLCAKAYDSPWFSAGVLIAYLAVFLLSVIFSLIQKMKKYGIIGFAIVIVVDLYTFIESAIFGENVYFSIGIPVCIIGLLLLWQHRGLLACDSTENGPVS